MPKIEFLQSLNSDIARFLNPIMSKFDQRSIFIQSHDS
ncbi:hypothetical protein D1BOALGB6SA_9349 [Olavius sp. associated proteobacterium Delta 1]|nr:hypothetical protein D1BOALGB6SA_9349 [Olavius sp. associated proteobacterium Delta 1]